MPIVKSNLHGAELLDTPLLNKSNAFTEAERDVLGLVGLLPPHVETLGEQVARAYEAYLNKDQDIERHIFLRALQDRNEVLFYHLISEHLSEMMPMIYTPVVGAACQQFSEIYRRARGLFISYPERHKIDDILENSPISKPEVIVVTDGERILGLGDQGAGGMGIPIGKLSLYTACGGIHPSTTLPILLDVGTNNKDLHKDPLYIGWRNERVIGQEYFDFVDMFVQAVKRKWPHILLQFEDFAQTHAGPILETYRDQLCTFNDDIQGTAAVTVGTLLAATKVKKGKLKDEIVVMFGAGSAGCGIAEQMVATMVQEGLSEADARSRFYMIDRHGLLHDDMKGLLPFQTKLLQPHDKVSSWASDSSGEISLLDAIKHAKATTLIGVSGQANTFTQDVIKAITENTSRPIVFPLSNPTSKIEAVPDDIMKWSDGKALIATGSPFDGVAQCNNSYIFPAMGLGILSVKAKHVSDAMFMAASEALSQHAPAIENPNGALLPPIGEAKAISKHIAFAVASQAIKDGHAKAVPDDKLQQLIDDKCWEPDYPVIES